MAPAPSRDRSTALAAALADAGFAALVTFGLSFPILAYRTEQDYTARLMGFDDSVEARAAYMEKRAPEWKWR